MLDEYHALGTAIRRPLRRWWRRVGLWWLLALFMLALLEGAVRGYLVPILEEQSQVLSTAAGGFRMVPWLGVMPWGWTALATVMVDLGRLIVLSACLLVAAQVMQQCHNIQREFAYPTPGTPRRLAYLLALANCWPFAALWLVLGGSVLTSAICGVTHRTLTVYYSSASLADIGLALVDPWALLVSIVLVLALAAITQPSFLAATIWLGGLTLGPLARACRDALLFLPLAQGRPTSAALSFSSLPEIDSSLGWVLGGLCVLGMLWCFRQGKQGLAGVLLALCLVSAVLSGFGGEVPFTHIRNVPQGLQQLPASSDAGLALILVRSLSDFQSAAPLVYQRFGESRVGWGFYSNRPEQGADGALRSVVPKTWIAVAPRWVGYLVAPLNLMYLAGLISLLAVLMLGEPRRRPSTR